MKNIPSTDYFRRGRVASKYALASPWVNFGTSPSQPTRMLSNVIVFDGWSNPSLACTAQRIVSDRPSISLRALQQLLLEMTETRAIDYPYIWWVNSTKEWKRALHEDANGLQFVKVHGKWHLAYPLDKVGGLAGAQYTDGYEDVPLFGYFILWDNEDCARKHTYG